MSIGAISNVSDIYTTSSAYNTTATEKPAAPEKASQAAQEAAPPSSGTTITNESGDSITIGAAESERVTYTANFALVLSQQAKQAAAVSAANGSTAATSEKAASSVTEKASASLDEGTSAKIDAMLEKAGKIADLYNQAQSEITAFQSFLNGALGTSGSKASTGLDYLQQALGVDASGLPTNGYETAMNKLQEVLDRRLGTGTDTASVEEATKTGTTSTTTATQEQTEASTVTLDGYYSANSTANRIFQMAKATAGEDVELLNQVKSSIADSFSQVEERYGGEGKLTQVSYDTMDKVNQLIDDYSATISKAAEAQLAAH